MLTDKLCGSWFHRLVPNQNWDRRQSLYLFLETIFPDLGRNMYVHEEVLVLGVSTSSCVGFGISIAYFICQFICFIVLYRTCYTPPTHRSRLCHFIVLDNCSAIKLLYRAFGVSFSFCHLWGRIYWALCKEMSMGTLGLFSLVSSSSLYFN